MARRFKERLRTGSDLGKFCSKQVGGDPKLLVFPIFAGIWIVLIPIIYFTGLFLIPSVEDLPGYVIILILILLAVVYLIAVFIRVFFEAAMVAYVHEKMEGGRSTVGLGLSRAWGRAGIIFKWAIFSAFVGVIIKVFTSLSSKAGGDSKVTTEDGEETEFTSFSGVWSMATYLVLPMILFEDTKFWKLPGRSGRLVTEFWGGELVGRLAVGVLFVLLLLPALIIFFYGLILGGSTGFIIVVVTVAYMISIASVRGVSGGVLSAAMYRYSQTGNIDLDLPQWLHPTDAPIERGQQKVDRDIAIKKKAEEEARKVVPEEGHFLYYLKGVLALSVFGMVVLGIVFLPGSATLFGYEPDSIIPSVGLFLAAVIIVVIMYGLGWIETVPDSPAESPTTTAVQHRSGPTIGSRVLVNIPGGREFRGMVTGVEYGMVTVRLKDGTEQHVDESCCTML